MKLRIPALLLLTATLAGCVLTDAPRELALQSVVPLPAPAGGSDAPEGAGEAAIFAAPLPPAQPAVAELAAEGTGDIWSRLEAGFGLPQAGHRRVTSHVRWYRKHPEHLQRVFTRAEPLLFYILEQVEKRGMPAEIALLPVVESAYQPFAYSHGRAAGLWQFVPATGRRFGLKQDWWYDGRRDVVESTRAALDYLEHLYGRYDDWLLALAAYNSGEGTVSKAIRSNRRKGRPTDFWHLRLPKETRAYVPRLLALQRVLADPDVRQKLPPIANEPRLTTVYTGGQIDLAVAAELADVPLETVYRLNPGFNRWATAPDGPHRLLLPLEAGARFEARIAGLSESERVKWQRHRIARGESLGRIARNYETTVQLLREVNRLSGSTIRAGDWLLIPVARTDLADYSLSIAQRTRQTRARPHGSTRVTHRVSRGDTLWALSRQYKVGVRDLARWNAMAPGDPLRPGHKLVIWLASADGAAHPGAKPQRVRYTVKRGDSLSRIARRFGVTTRDLVRWNKLSRDKYLQPGQRLTLYVDVTRVAEAI